MSILDEIAELTAKQDKAKAALAKAKAQKEALEERKQELVDRLKGEYGVTVKEAAKKIKDMEKEAASLLEKAKAKLDSINL
jgi:predicted transcriptional regulator